MHTGTVSFSAIAAPRYRRSPKTISKLRSARGRTNKGCNTPFSRTEQEQALAHCFREDWSNGNKAKRILLPVRQLQGWIEQNILLILKDAPFSKRDAQLVPAAGSCLECPKRTGFNKLLFTGISENSDACSDPTCYAAKLDAHVKKTVAAKPKLVQISTA
jgi:ParB family chromosome partitioning protein